MKKTLLILGAALCCLMGLSACGDKDDPVEEAKAAYNFTITQDLKDACDLIIIHYKGNNGEDKMVSMDGLTWTMTVTSNQSTATFGYKVDLSIKSESELAKSEYNLVANGAISVQRGGQQSSNSNAIHIEKAACPKADVGKTLRMLDGKATGYRVDSKGTATPMNDLNFN